jgi:pentatricopeptide repeat protein
MLRCLSIAGSYSCYLASKLRFTRRPAFNAIASSGIGFGCRFIRWSSPSPSPPHGWAPPNQVPDVSSRRVPRLAGGAQGKDDRVTTIQITKRMYEHAKRGNVLGAEQEFSNFVEDGPGPRADAVAWGVLMFAHAQNANPQGAEDVLRRMSTAGVTPGINAWSSLLRSYAVRGDVLGTEDVVRRMTAAAVAPDIRAWTSVLNSYARAGEHQGALEVLFRMRRHGCTVDTQAMGALVHSLAEGSDVDAIRVIVQQCSDSDVALTTRMWTSVIHAHARRGDIKEAMSTLRHATSLGCEADAGVWEVVALAHAQAGDVRGVEDVINQGGLNVATSAVLHARVTALMQQGLFSDAVAAVQQQLTNNLGFAGAGFSCEAVVSHSTVDALLMAMTTRGLLLEAVELLVTISQWHVHMPLKAAVTNDLSDRVGAMHVDAAYRLLCACRMLRSQDTVRAWGAVLPACSSALAVDIVAMTMRVAKHTHDCMFNGAGCAHTKDWILSDNDIASIITAVALRYGGWSAAVVVHKLFDLSSHTLYLSTKNLVNEGCWETAALMLVNLRRMRQEEGRSASEAPFWLLNDCWNHLSLTQPLHMTSSSRGILQIAKAEGMDLPPLMCDRLLRCASFDGTWAACRSAYEMVTKCGSAEREHAWADMLLVTGAANSMSQEALEEAFTATGMQGGDLFPLIQRCRMHARLGDVGNVVTLRDAILTMASGVGDGQMTGLQSAADHVALCESDDIELKMSNFGAANMWGSGSGGVEVQRYGDVHSGSRGGSRDTIFNSSADARKCAWWLPALIMTARVQRHVFSSASHMMECLEAWEREIFPDGQVTCHRSLLWKRVADECAGAQQFERALYCLLMCRVGRGTTLLRRFVRRCFAGASYAAASALSSTGAKEQLQRLEAIMSAAEVIAAKGWMSKHDAASMMARCLLTCGHSSHAASVMMRMGSCHAEVWRKIFRKSLQAALCEGGQDELLRVVFGFQSQIKALEAVFDRGVLMALLHQESALLGLKQHQPQDNAGSFNVDHDHQPSLSSAAGSACDTLSLTSILNSFSISSSTPPSAPASATAGATSRSKRLKGNAAAVFAGDAARALQSKLAAASLRASPDEASHVHARAMWLMSSPSHSYGGSALSPSDKSQRSIALQIKGSDQSCLNPDIMRDAVRLCALACDTGEWFNEGHVLQSSCNSLDAASGIGPATLEMVASALWCTQQQVGSIDRVGSSCLICIFADQRAQD